MSPMARRFLSRCPRLRLSKMVSGSPRTLSSASARGLFRYTARQGFRFAAPWARFSFALSHAKIAGLSGGEVNSQKRPPGPLFRRVDNAAIVNWPPPPHSGGLPKRNKIRLVVAFAMKSCVLDT